MAIYTLSASNCSRSDSSSNPSLDCSAYINRENQFKSFGKVLFSSLFCPSELSTNNNHLWKAVENSEKRIDAGVAKKILIALPNELTLEQNIELVKEFVKVNIADRNLLADVAIHPPHESGDDRNIHCHILMNKRQYINGEFSKKKERDIDKVGWLYKTRESWASICNKHLERANINDKIDHRRISVQRNEAIRNGDYEKALELCRMPGVHHGRAMTNRIREGKESEKENWIEREYKQSEKYKNEVRLVNETKAMLEDILEKQRIEEQIKEVENQINSYWKKLEKEKRREQIKKEAEEIKKKEKSNGRNQGDKGLNRNNRGNYSNNQKLDKGRELGDSTGEKSTSETLREIRDKYRQRQHELRYKYDADYRKSVDDERERQEALERERRKAELADQKRRDEIERAKKLERELREKRKREHEQSQERNNGRGL